MSLSFVVTSYVQNDIQLRQLQRCINSIVNYSNYNYLYIISNSIDYDLNLLNNLFKDINNIVIMEGNNKKAAAGNAYELILSLNDGSDYYCVFQDSMVLNKKIKDISYINDVQFLWHFTCNRNIWNNYSLLDKNDVIPEAVDNNFKNYTDLLRYHFINYCNKDEGLVKYALHALNNMDIWCGCFGVCSIIKKETLKYLEDKCGIVTYLKRARNPFDRTIEENVFAIVCHYYLPQNYENSFDGLYYDGITINRNNGTPVGVDGLIYAAQNEYISKILFGR